MQVYGGVKLEKGFMNTISKFCILLFLFLLACKQDDDGNQQNIIPNVPVNSVVNTDLPLFQHLRQLGSYQYLDDGYKGIVLLHNYDDQFYALERSCTYHPFDSCAIVEVNEENLNLRCGSKNNGQFKACCASTFQYDGFVGDGPARFPLKRYTIQQSGATLIIRN